MPAVDAPWQANGRRAVTLLELFVTLFVIAALLALAAPAIQSARESARRAQCQTNLRQILLATQAFHSAEGSLPSLYNGTSARYPLAEWDLFHMHSWRVLLLPHLQQNTLFQRVAWDELATEPANASIARTVVPAYVCPTGSDPSVDMGRGLRHAFTHAAPNAVSDAGWYSVARSDYDAMAGIQVLPDPMPKDSNPQAVRHLRWGVWGWPRFDNGAISGGRLIQYRAGKFRDITDGLSNTIVVVERGGKPTDFAHGKPNVTQYNADAAYPGQVGWSASNTFSWSVNGFRVGVNEFNASGIYSLHPGGANVSMADGSTRFLAESTAFNALVEMFSRSDDR